MPIPELESDHVERKESFRDRPFDVQPMPSATLGDLDRGRFESEYLPAAVAPDVLEANDRSLEQRLAATKLIVSAEETTPTVLGLLVAGRSPVDSGHVLVTLRPSK